MVHDQVARPVRPRGQDGYCLWKVFERLDQAFGVLREPAVVHAGPLDGEGASYARRRSSWCPTSLPNARPRANCARGATLLLEHERQQQDEQQDRDDRSHSDVHQVLPDRFQDPNSRFPGVQSGVEGHPGSLPVAAIRRNMRALGRSRRRSVSGSYEKKPKRGW